MELVPTRFLFDFEFPLRYRASAPRWTGDLADWSEEFRLPPLCRLEGQEPFAPVYACWNEAGLYLAVGVGDKHHPLYCDPQHFADSDHLCVCTDTRDTRNIRRASPYCQQFYFLPTGGGPEKDRPVAATVKIERAREDAPPVKPGILQVAASISESGYRLQSHVPAEALYGFDPAEHPRLGFSYLLQDQDHGGQYLTVGDELQGHVDPSTWATAVLVR